MHCKRLPAADLARLLTDARARTLALFEALTDEQLAVPYLPTLNPPLWEFGHVAWFQERWALRHLRGLPPLREQADALYDSARIPHEQRWHLPLPSRAGTLDYLAGVLDGVLGLLGRGEPDEQATYFHLLALFHEDMHAEACVYTRQTLAHPPPPAAAPAGREITLPPPGPCPGDVDVPGGALRLGADREAAFVFDNEKWAHAVEVKRFRIARAPVTNGEFARFVEDGGYARRELWSEAGWAWREEAGANCPLYWRRGPGGWERRHYDRFVPLGEHVPLLHVSWYEAEAYCRWADRRLPTEAEWEMAASGEPGSSRKRRYPWGDEPPTPERANLDLRHAGPVAVNAFAAGDSAFGCRQLLGNVWEWTADDFLPYPGFSPDPYREYSAPWFGTHKVLRGGAFATRGRLISNVYRNFYTPDRRDVLAGFRTCSR
jgi:gamma-glutamyl hercynylcysteine S-oxide synthase